MYWFPVFAFIRRRGYSADEAEDLTQAFFTRMIAKGDLRGADRERGRFRTFLLSACQFLAVSHRTQPGAELGTVGYMAPEQVRGEALVLGWLALRNWLGDRESNPD